jgi:hypothetical protein
MDAKDGLLRVSRASVCYPSNCAVTARGRRVYGKGGRVGVVGKRKGVVKLRNATCHEIVRKVKERGRRQCEHRSIGALFLVTRAGNSAKHDTASHNFGLSTVIRSDARFGGVNDGRSGRSRALSTMVLATTTTGGRN